MENRLLSNPSSQGQTLRKELLLQPWQKNFETLIHRKNVREDRAARYKKDLIFFYWAKGKVALKIGTYESLDLEVMHPMTSYILLPNSI